tara:strand:+ start:132 stop:311 length:180 start_codon:yes stop_codon:yes gene_type:complete
MDDFIPNLKPYILGALVEFHGKVLTTDLIDHLSTAIALDINDALLLCKNPESELQVKNN